MLQQYLTNCIYEVLITEDSIILFSQSLLFISFIQAYRIQENQFIDIGDGVRLAARIWFPDGISENNKMPAILEFLPYRKRDTTVFRDEITYAYFAENEYVGVGATQNPYSPYTSVWYYIQ